MQQLRDEVTRLAAEISFVKVILRSGKRAGQQKATSWPRKGLVQGTLLVPAYTPLPCQGLRVELLRLQSPFSWPALTWLFPCSLVSSPGRSANERGNV